LGDLETNWVGEVVQSRRDGSIELVEWVELVWLTVGFGGNWLEGACGLMDSLAEVSRILNAYAKAILAPDSWLLIPADFVFGGKSRGAAPWLFMGGRNSIFLRLRGGSAPPARTPRLQ
jgi:hypothetical protein